MEKKITELFKLVHSSYKIFKYKDTCKHEPVKNKKSVSFTCSGSTYPVIGLSTSGLMWEYLSNSTGEEEYKLHYGNPLSTVHHRRFTIVVTSTEDKINIKIFSYYRRRLHGDKFFRLETMVNYLTYNHKSNSLYYGFIRDYHKKRKFVKSVRKNVFLNGPINRIKCILNSYLSDYGKDDSEFLLKKNDTINQIINVFLNNVPGIEKYKNLDPDEALYKLHLEKWAVKLPNNWTSFIRSYPQPKKKDFVKNKMKYMDTIMVLHKLRGDKIKKILHKVNDFQGTSVFNWACNFFGRDFIMNQHDNFLVDLFEISHSIPLPYNVDNKLFTKKELLNAFMIYKLCLVNEIEVYNFFDHVRMIMRIKNFENIKWESNTYTEFMDEHYMLSEKLGFYTKGDFKRIYDNDFIEKIQEKITLNDEYYPIVLTTSKEYNMESLIQSNCVRTYINRAPSLIISLRKNTIDSNNRATIEFRINIINDKIILRRVQTLGRFNSKLGNDWDDAIRLLDIKIEELTDRKLFKLPSIEAKIGNSVLSSNSSFSKINHFNSYHFEDEVLVWDNKSIDEINSINNETILHN